jgi:hypothetical protein
MHSSSLSPPSSFLFLSLFSLSASLLSPSCTYYRSIYSIFFSSLSPLPISFLSFLFQLSLQFPPLLSPSPFPLLSLSPLPIFFSFPASLCYFAFLPLSTLPPLPGHHTLLPFLSPSFPASLFPLFPLPLPLPLPLSPQGGSPFLTEQLSPVSSSLFPPSSLSPPHLPISSSPLPSPLPPPSFSPPSLSLLSFPPFSSLFPLPSPSPSLHGCLTPICAGSPSEVDP